MDRLDRITKLQFAGFFAYFITLFFPMYATSFFGASITASVSEFGLGTFYVTVFFVLILGMFFLKFFNEKFYKIAYFVTTGFMVLLVLLIFINPDKNDILFTLFLQILIITYLFLAMFLKDVVIKVMDKIRGMSNTLVDAIIKLGNGELADVFKAQHESEDSNEVVEGEFTDY